MIYTLEFSDKSLKQLKKLDREYHLRIIATLERIRIRPEVHLKKLVSEKYYSLRVGKFRVIIDFQREKFIILVIALDLRGNVYEKLKKLKR